MTVFAQGGDTDPNDPLLNPAHVILGANADPANKQIWQMFMQWVNLPDGGQQVITDFKENGEQVYSQAPANATLACTTA